MDAKARHCRIAELSAVYAVCGTGSGDDPELFSFRAEHALLQSRVFTLLRKTIRISLVMGSGASGSEGTGVSIRTDDPDGARRVRRALEIRDDMDLEERICSRSCCVRAFLRGIFLAAGSVSDPEKSYHFEIVCASQALSERVLSLIRRYEIDARITLRKGRYVVYVKESTQIVDLLNIMGAHTSLMQMENVRIIKDVRGRINRQVNCETANLNKTVTASVREAEEIRRLEEAGILKTLSAPLRETAALRMEHPEASLRELGEMHDPPLGRSGVNHRLKKISEIASGVSSGNHGGNHLL